MTNRPDNNAGNQFSHLNAVGEANMVDVSGKPDSSRMAIAQAVILLGEAVLQQVRSRNIAKGDLFAIARVAGIQAAKQCSNLIPLCHPLYLSKVAVDIREFAEGDKFGLQVIATCWTTGKTGVEMEALTAASVAALTIYDMCKALDKGIVIEAVQLLEKHGGKSGHWVRQGD